MPLSILTAQTSYEYFRYYERIYYVKWPFGSGRNEIIETSGRVHPLWPQNKRLHTPWTKDYMHTRQDRWIQTELAFTFAKNATKPNPFEIVPLQTTRKENNWKTEEMLARAVVTLEKERIKVSNPWCLWWWWWHFGHSILCQHIESVNFVQFPWQTTISPLTEKTNWFKQSVTSGSCELKF